MKPVILLVEDNEQNRYLTTYLLEKHGYGVISAVDGLAAQELLKTVKPALILLDIQLPGMDGYSVARAIREDEDFDEVPIVAVTSYALAGDREKVMAAGCNGYFEKPINPDTFVTEIAVFLEQSQPPMNADERG